MHQYLTTFSPLNPTGAPLTIESIAAHHTAIDIEALLSLVNPAVYHVDRWRMVTPSSRVPGLTYCVRYRRADGIEVVS